MRIKDRMAPFPDGVMDTHILSYFSVFFTELFDEVFVFEPLSLDMIRWSVTCCHHVHSQSHEVNTIEYYRMLSRVRLHAVLGFTQHCSILRYDMSAFSHES